MVISENTLNSNPYYTKKTDLEYTLLDPNCVNLFDQNGYHLTLAEQAFLVANGYKAVERRHEDSLRYDWILWDKRQGAHINHSDLFERKGFSEDAKEQLQVLATKNPMLYKLVKMKPKWGIDISIDYVSEDAVFEVFHYEWDSFNYENLVNKKEEVENFVVRTDWEDVAKTLWKIKDRWYNLDFFSQTQWRTDYFGLSPEKFKNNIWDL
jgi:hypothetical protein